MNVQALNQKQQKCRWVVAEPRDVKVEEGILRQRGNKRECEGKIGGGGSRGGSTKTTETWKSRTGT